MSPLSSTTFVRTAASVDRDHCRMSSVSEIRERFVGATDIGREAFEELANYCATLEAEKEEKADMARCGEKHFFFL